MQQVGMEDMEEDRKPAGRTPKNKAGVVQGKKRRGSVSVPKKKKAKGNSSDQDEYAVEKIVDKKVDKDGRVEYFIKWQGWPT